MNTTGTTTVVGYKGYEYRTLDGTAPTDYSEGCQSEYMALPAGGWALAEINADAVAVAFKYTWGTYCLVFANGDAIFRSTWGESCGSGSLSQSGNLYNVVKSFPCNCSSCDFALSHRRILLRRPCAAGCQWWSSRMETYLEAATATCPCTYVTVVAFKGYEYRTLDGTAPTDTSYGCQWNTMGLPNAGRAWQWQWQLAPDDADTRAVAFAYRWGMSCLVFANQFSIFTANHLLRKGARYMASKYIPTTMCPAK